jgi:hypothetical protein
LKGFRARRVLRSSHPPTSAGSAYVTGAADIAGVEAAVGDGATVGSPGADGVGGGAGGGGGGGGVSLGFAGGAVTIGVGSAMTARLVAKARGVGAIKAKAVDTSAISAHLTRNATLCIVSSRIVHWRNPMIDGRSRYCRYVDIWVDCLPHENVKRIAGLRNQLHTPALHCGYNRRAPVRAFKRYDDWSLGHCLSADKIGKDPSSSLLRPSIQNLERRKQNKEQR